MASRRQKIHDHYAAKAYHGLSGQAISKAAATRYVFRGDQLAGAVIVRCDINKYSDWARERTITDRVGLLNELFSATIPQIDCAGGVYFRDEGDCIVVIFSDYFAPNVTFANVIGFCQAVVRLTYGPSELGVKCTVASGQIAIFQKDHERGTEDWSAEGEPFVRAARLEQAVVSKRAIAFYTDQFNSYFDRSVTYADPGKPFSWIISHEKLQVAGLGLAGGWEEVTYMTYQGN